MNDSHNWHFARWSKNYCGMFFDTWGYDNTPQGIKDADARYWLCKNMKTINGEVLRVTKNISRGKKEVYIIMVTQFY